MKKNQEGYIVFVVLMILVAVSAYALNSARLANVSSFVTKQAFTKRLLQQEAEIYMSYIKNMNVNDTSGVFATLRGWVNSYGYNVEGMSCSTDTDVTPDLSPKHSGTLGSVAGYCKATTFTSERKMIHVQVSIKMLDSSTYQVSTTAFYYPPQRYNKNPSEKTIYCAQNKYAMPTTAGEDSMAVCFDKNNIMSYTLVSKIKA